MITLLRAPSRSFAALALFSLAAAWSSFAAAQQLSIADVSVSEGNSGTKLMVFTINLSAASASPVRVDVATSDGTALAGSDYVAASTLGLRFPAGTTSKNFAVSIIGDTSAESSETVKVNLSNATGATISDAQAIGTITNDDGASLPSLSIGDVSNTEGASGTFRMLTFTVSLSAPAATAVTYNIATADGTATAGSDYVASSLVGQSIPAGETSKTFTVTINGDADIEQDETLQVNVSSVSGATVGDGQAIGTISNDDDSNLPILSVNDISTTEGDDGYKWVTFTVSLSLTSSTPVQFNIWTTDGTAGSGDYLPSTAINQVIEPGYSVKDFQVQVHGDTVTESDEVFHVFLEAVSGARVVDPNGDATIIDDDPATPQLSLRDATVVEGSAGSSALLFEARLSKPAAVPVSFNFATSDGSATAGSDYDAQSLVGILTIPVGQISITFPVVVKGDLVAEANEYLNAAISNAVGAPIARANATGLIWNDDGNILVTAPFDPLKQSTGSTGFNANGQSISADGRFVAFISGANDLVAGQPTNSYYDIFWRDLRTGETRLVSFGYGNAATNGSSGYPSISADGRYVVFESYASNILPGENATGDVFRRDMSAGVTELVSVGLGGASSATYESNASAMSADGRFVAFQSSAPDIVANDTNGKQDVFVRDMQTGTTTLVSVATAGPSAPVNGSQGPRVSADGRYVSFASDDPNIVAGDTDGLLNAFIRDRQAGTTSKVAFDPGFVTYGASLSGNGRYLLFSAQDPALLQSHLYVRDLQTNAIEMIDVRYDGQTIPKFGAGVYSTSISDDGRYVGFYTYENGMVASDNNGQADVFVRDTVLDTTWMAPGEASLNPVLSADGKYLVYGTISNTMSVGDGNSQADSFRVPVPQVAMPSLSISDYWVQEGDSGTKQLTVTVTLSAPATTPVTFDFDTVDGIAYQNSDYFAKHSHGLSIPVGQNSKSVTITILGDAWYEPDESFDVALTNVRGATVADDHALVIIGNDDVVPVSISVGDASVSEGNSGTKLMSFTVSLSAPAATDVTYTVGASDLTATSGIDFASTLVDYVLPAGATSQTVTVAINGDIEPEQDETFTLSLFNVSPNAIAADDHGIGTILDDDYANAPSLSIGDASIAEGNSSFQVLTFPVTLSKVAASPVCFGLTVASGTATAGSDYADTGANVCIEAGFSSLNFDVSIAGDSVVEPNETFSVTAVNVTGANVADGTAIGTIINDDVAVGPSLSIADVSIAEGNSGTKTATFTVTLSQAVSGPVIFNIATANGTATAGSDYVAKTTNGLRIAAGQTSKTFLVTINGDTVSEPNETFTVNLSNASGATIGDGQAVGTITNDDAAATPTLSIADASVSEGNSGTKILTFTVSLSPAAAGTVSYDIATSNGTATSGSDYVASTLTGQTIAAGATSKTFAVTINGDATTEANETFNVTVSNVSGATLGDGSAIGTITNDDGGTGPTVSIGDVSIAEGQLGTKSATFTVTLSAAASTAVTYTIATADGTATSPADYTAKSMTGQSIPAGTLSKTFVVAVKGDKVAEPNETFTVNLSAVTGATVADGQAIGTITNDDAAALSIARFDARGLVDDIDDGNRVPQVSAGEYALLLLDSAKGICARTAAANIVAVEGIENRAVLADLAETANATCAQKPRYAAVMADGDSRGFLVEVPATTDARGLQVLGEPSSDATAKLSSLQVQGSGHAGPITLLLPQALPASAVARTQQLRALGNFVQAQLKAEPDARLVLIGGVTLPGLLDLTARSLPAKSALPGERVLVSPALLDEFGKATVAFPALPATEPPAQVLQLQR